MESWPGCHEAIGFLRPGSLPPVFHGWTPHSVTVVVIAVVPVRPALDSLGLGLWQNLVGDPGRITYRYGHGLE